MRRLRYAIFCLVLSVLVLNAWKAARAVLPWTPKEPAKEEASKRLLSVLPSHKLIYKGGDQDYYLMASLEGPARSNAAKLPLNLSIVIDRSGSMTDKGKLDFVKRAAKTFINQLRAEDRVSIVDYDDTVTVLAEPAFIGSHRGRLLEKIEGLTPRGSTNLAGGMMEGAAQVEKYLSSKSVNRVLLLSDGLANVGVSSRADVENLARQLGRKGIQVTTFGVGADFDEDMMTGIADASAGNYYFIESPAQVAAIFEKERNALTQVVAKNSQLEIKVDEAFEAAEVYGYSYRTEGGRIVIGLPDLYSGQKRKVLLRLKPRRSVIGEQTVAHVTYRFEDARHDSRAVQEDWTLKSDVTNDLKAFEASMQASVQSEVLRARAGQTMQTAMKNYEGGFTQQAQDDLKRARDHLQDAFNLAPSPKLKRQLDEAEKAVSGVANMSPGSEEGKTMIKQQKSEAREAMH